jgi:sigma-B regulation protein RsbU (phosphoserine phosphatase)
LEWVRAGHDPAMLYEPETGAFSELKGPGPALGVVEDYAFEKSGQVRFAPGQILFVGTDGIWESRNPDGEMFGKEKVKRIVRRNAKKTASEIVQAVVSELSDFRGDQVQDDDVTLIVMKFDGS